MSKNKYLIIFSLLMVLCLAIIFWIILPTIKNINQYNIKVYTNKEKLSELLAQGQSVTKIREDLKQLQQKIGVLDEGWLKIGNELAFITDLEKAADKYQLQQTLIFDNTKGTIQTGTTQIKVIPLELKITGGLNNIMQYINTLETFNYYINFQKIDMQVQKATTKKYPSQITSEENTTVDEIKLSINLVGNTYWK